MTHSRKPPKWDTTADNELIALHEELGDDFEAIAQRAGRARGEIVRKRLEFLRVIEKPPKKQRKPAAVEEVRPGIRNVLVRSSFQSDRPSTYKRVSLADV